MDTPEYREFIKELPGRKYPVYDGYILPKFSPLLPDPTKHMEAIRNFDSKETDILLCTFPKTGTNWVYEIVWMLLHGQSEYSKNFKGAVMMEAVPIEMMQQEDSPRFLNTHVPFRHIPKKHVDNGYKIIHVLRNPKDITVSWYNHVKNDPFTTCTTENYPGTWAEFISDTCAGKHDFYDGIFKYEREWEIAKTTDAVRNVHTAFYEDIKKNPVAEIERLAKFLGVDVTDKLMQEIADKCSFQNLMAASKQKEGAEILDKLSKDGSNFLFRKGTIGDWKNWFTVAQNEMFDSVLDKEMKDSKIKFTYDF